jgi:hypothetical protein
MTIHDLASRGLPRLIKGQAAITNMKNGNETADSHGIAVQEERCAWGNIVGQRLCRRGLLRGRMRC